MSWMDAEVIIMDRWYMEYVCQHRGVVTTSQNVLGIHVRKEGNNNIPINYYKYYKRNVCFWRCKRCCTVFSNLATQNMAASFIHPSLPSLPLYPPGDKRRETKKATSRAWFQRANFSTHSTKTGLDTRSRCIGTDGMETQTGMGRCFL